MLCFCPNGHGYQPPVPVSPDYDGAHKSVFQSRCLLVRFIYNDEVADIYRLSPEFVAAEHVQVGDQPLPDDYPAWVHKVRFICAKCYAEPTRNETVA